MLGATDPLGAAILFALTMSDDLTFQDTPLYAWLKTNMWYLLGGLGIFLAIMLYRENAPRWEHANFSESWDQHRALISDPDGLDKLAQQLAEAKKDERIYEWIVYNAARTASDLSDQAALALLKPELESLAKSSEVMIASAGGQQKLAQFLLENLYQSKGLLPLNPTAPEPTGGRIQITLSLDDTTTYDIVLGLYEEQAPNGTQALKDWVAAGRLSEQTARRVGSQNLTFTLAALETGEEEATEEETEDSSQQPDLLVERQHGFYHSEGTLSPAILPGRPGVQDVNNLQLALLNSYNMDGQTTVLAKVVEGFQALKDGLELAGPTAELKIVEAKILE